MNLVLFIISLLVFSSKAISLSDLNSEDPLGDTLSTKLNEEPKEGTIEFWSQKLLEAKTLKKIWDLREAEAEEKLQELQPCSSDEMLVEFTIKTDSEPTETSWFLRIRPAGRFIANKPVGFYTESFKEYYYRYCVPDHQLYEFRINDTGNNGIQGENGDGYYRLEVNGEIEDEGGDFDRFEIDYFEGICDGDFAPLAFTIHTGTNPHFVSWVLSADTEVDHLPASGGPYTDPSVLGQNLNFKMHYCLPIESCYTLKVKSDPSSNDYEPSEGGSIEVDFASSNFGYDIFSDGDEKRYIFGAGCNNDPANSRFCPPTKPSDSDECSEEFTDSCRYSPYYVCPDDEEPVYLDSCTCGVPGGLVDGFFSCATLSMLPCGYQNDGNVDVYDKNSVQPYESEDNEKGSESGDINILLYNELEDELDEIKEMLVNIKQDHLN